MENASRAFLDAVRKSMRQIRSIIGATVINPALLTCAERLQYDGYQRREEANEAVMTLFEAGVPIKQIVRRTGLARDTVRRIVRGQRSDVFQTRQSSLEELLPWLDAQWDAGNRNVAALRSAMRGARIPRQSASCVRMGHPPEAGLEGRCRHPDTDPLGAYDRPLHNERAR